MVLAGSDTYTGGTTVEGGTLIVQYPWSIDANGEGTNLSVGSPTLLHQFGTVLSAGDESTVSSGRAGAGARHVWPARGRFDRKRGGLWPAAAIGLAPL